MALPMGCSISCSAFEKSSTFKSGPLGNGLEPIKLYTLYFCLFAGRAGSSDCRVHLEAFQELAAALNVSLAAKKMKGRATLRSFLDIINYTER